MSRAQRSKTPRAAGVKSQLDLFSVSLDADAVTPKTVATWRIADDRRHLNPSTATCKLGPFVKSVRSAAATPTRALDTTAARSPRDGNPSMPRLSVASPTQPSGAQRLPEVPDEPVTPRQGALLNVRQAAAWLGLSKSTLDKMRCYGVGPQFIRATGRAVRYDPADLAAFAAARRQSRTSGEAPA